MSSQLTALFTMDSRQFNLPTVNTEAFRHHSGEHSETIAPNKDVKLNWRNFSQLRRPNKTLMYFALVSIVLFMFKTVLEITFPNENLELSTEFMEPNWRSLSRRERAKFSKLGKILFLNDKRPPIRNRTFHILVWKGGPVLERRYGSNYDKRKCSAHNCKISYNQEHLHSADAVVFPLKTFADQTTALPLVRKSDQIWIALTDDQPMYMFPGKPVHFLKTFDGFFNWTMSYRLDSDVPVPYGRAVMKPPAEATRQVDLLKYKRASNAGTQIVTEDVPMSHLEMYLNDMRRRIDIDVLKVDEQRRCFNNAKKHCDILDNYIFYLVLDDGFCEGYITDKIWWSAYEHELVPVIFGSSTWDLIPYLPPDSYINGAEFSTALKLARYLQKSINDHTYVQYYAWKQKFEIINEHGIHGTTNMHYCRLCEALNYNDLTPKVYPLLSQRWNASKECTLYIWDERFALDSENEESMFDIVTKFY